MGRKWLKTDFVSFAVQPDCVKGQVVYGIMDYKDLLNQLQK